MAMRLLERVYWNCFTLWHVRDEQRFPFRPPMLDLHRSGNAGFGNLLLEVALVQLWAELFPRGCPEWTDR